MTFQVLGMNRILLKEATRNGIVGVIPSFPDDNQQACRHIGIGLTVGSENR